MSSRKKKRAAKRKKKDRHDMEMQDGESDNLSEASAMSFGGHDIDPGFKDKYLGDIQDALEPLVEKRSKFGSQDRTKSYVIITNLLSKSVWTDWCDENQELLKQCVVDSIKRGDNKERGACFKCCSLLVVTLADELTNSFSDGVGAALWSLCSDPEFFAGEEETVSATSGFEAKTEVKQEHPKLVRDALVLLGLLGYVGGDRKAKLEIAERLFTMWSDNNMSTTIRTGALEAWTLVISKFPIKEKGRDFFRRAIGLLIEIIEQDPTPNIQELFIAAGLAISLLYEAYFHVMTAEPESGDEEEEDDNEKYFDDEELPDSEYVHALLEGMSTQSAKGQKKETVKVQRKHFRDFANAVEDGYSPTIRVKLKGQAFEILGWPNSIIFEHIKRSLGGGLQAHMIGNIWLQEEFGVDASRLVCSPASRETRTQNRQDKFTREANKQENKIKKKKARDKKFAQRENFEF